MKFWRILVSLLISSAFCGCQRKAAENLNYPVEIISLASFNLLEDLESEDSYLGSELEEQDTQKEIETRSAELLKQNDKNRNNSIESDELILVRKLYKDKMLEKFDVDSDGSFSQAEISTIRDQIRQRIGEFKKLHPESFSQKRSVVCKAASQRGAPRPLWQSLLEKCEG